MKYTIRRSKIDEMNATMEAHSRSIRELCSKDYNQEQIEKWSDLRYTSEVWSKTVNDEYHLVIEVDGKIEGFCHAKLHENGVGEIAGLYFTPKIQGQGIGREVFNKTMDYFKSNHCTKLFLFGTKTAKPFYEKMGFVEVEKEEFSIRGTMVECFKMEKTIR